MVMWQPSILGDVIAERRFAARTSSRRAKSAVVRFGRPVQSPVAGDPWWCPFEISGIGKPRFFAAAGEDSVQALILALRAADVTLANLRDKSGIEVEWLGEKERPIFFHTHVVDMYEGAIDNLLMALRKAIGVIEGAPDAREWMSGVAELRGLERRRGFGQKHMPQRRGGRPTRR